MEKKIKNKKKKKKYYKKINNKYIYIIHENLKIICL